MIKQVFSRLIPVLTFARDTCFYSSPRVSLLLLLTLFTAVTAAPAQEAQWRPFSPAEGDFSVLTPVPLESKDKAPFSPGIKGLSYEAAHGGKFYFVSVLVGTFGPLATGVTADFMKAFNRGVEGNFCSQISKNGQSCRLANESASTIHGVPTRKYSLLLNEGEVGIVRIMFGVKRIYICAVVGKSLNHSDATRYIDSFTVGPGALSEMTAATRATGDAVKEALERGAMALNSRRYEEAEREFRQALALNPQEARAYVGLGSIHLDRGQHKEGIEAFRQAILLDPNSAVAHYNLGVLYSNLGFTYSVLVDSNSVLKKFAAFAQATDAFQQAVRIDPSFADAHYNLGVVHRALYKDKEAAQAFLRALALYQALLMGDPKSVSLHYRSGLAALWSGKRVDALEQYRALQQLDSSFADKLMVEINRHGGPTKKQ